jgi:hypothetical protein
MAFIDRMKENSTTITLTLILLLLGGGLSGYFYFYDHEEKDTTNYLLFLLSGSPTFSPTIDGQFTSGDGWALAEYQFTEYLITDDESLDAYNYFYVQLTENYLYACADLVSDITNEVGTSLGGDPWFPSGEEWFSMWIDTDNGGDYFTSPETWNATLSDGGEEMFCYIPQNDTFLGYFYDAIHAESYRATLNESNVDLEYGFQTTAFGSIAHRVYEVRINREALEALSTNFSLAFLGYGTMFTVPTSNYWGAPTYFVDEIYYNGWIWESTYFSCGTDTWDLDTIPTNST